MARVLMASALILSLLSGSQVKAAALGDPCTTAVECDDTTDITCDLGVGGTELCKKKIDQRCGGKDDCPVHSDCTNDKGCQCDNGYVVVLDICEKENGATTLAVPSMLLTLSVIVGLSFFSMAPF